MKKRSVLALAFLLVLLATLILPAHAQDHVRCGTEAEPLVCDPSSGAHIAPQSTLPDLRNPSQEEIRSKWNQVTSAASIFVSKPSVEAPYATGELSEDFLESGLTYLNYVRFVAGLPEVTLDDALNENAQHGAVLLAAIDQLSHYPHQPSDMDDAFYEQGYAATTSSNLSGYWGFANLTDMLQYAVSGCMDDNTSVNNLATVGHRRWLLNPTLGKVGFGYAESNTGWSYIVTRVFDDSGTGCNFDFIGWPVAGNHPTNLFNTQNPWSLTLNRDIYKTPSAKNVKITLTRESDGKQWLFDSATGSPSYSGNDYIAPYMTVENNWYGLPNCIIFHPGTGNVDAYTGTFHVEVSGIFLRNGDETSLTYDVEFFDVQTVCTQHNYEAEITEPTCQEEGFTTYTCENCSHSYVDNYTDPVDHIYEDGHCKWCGAAQGLWGDVNGDGKINHNDARLVLQYYVGIAKADSLNLTVADVDGNGKINHNDARLILQYYVGILTGFPVED